MAYKISADQWESYWLSDNSIGVVDVHEQHLARVVQILSEQYPGILFLWDAPGRNRTCSISAVRPDRRAISGKQEESIVAAAEKIASNVASKHPIKRSLIRWLFRRPVKSGWHSTEKA